MDYHKASWLFIFLLVAVRGYGQEVTALPDSLAVEEVLLCETSKAQVIERVEEGRSYPYRYYKEEQQKGYAKYVLRHEFLPFEEFYTEYKQRFTLKKALELRGYLREVVLAESPKQELDGLVVVLWYLLNTKGELVFCAVGSNKRLTEYYSTDLINELINTVRGFRFSTICDEFEDGQFTENKVGIVTKRGL